MIEKRPKTLKVTITIEDENGERKFGYTADDNTNLTIDYTPTLVCANMDEPDKLAEEEVKLTIVYKEPLVL